VGDKYFSQTQPGSKLLTAKGGRAAKSPEKTTKGTLVCGGETDENNEIQLVVPLRTWDSPEEIR